MPKKYTANPYSHPTQQSTDTWTIHSRCTYMCSCPNKEFLLNCTPPHTHTHMSAHHTQLHQHCHHRFMRLHCMSILILSNSRLTTVQWLVGQNWLDHFTLYFIRQNSVSYACTSCSVMKEITFISDTFPSRSFLIHFYVLLKEHCFIVELCRVIWDRESVQLCFIQLYKFKYIKNVHQFSDVGICCPLKFRQRQLWSNFCFNLATWFSFLSFWYTWLSHPTVCMGNLFFVFCSCGKPVVTEWDYPARSVLNNEKSCQKQKMTLRKKENRKIKEGEKITCCHPRFVVIQPLFLLCSLHRQRRTSSGMQLPRFSFSLQRFRMRTLVGSTCSCYCQTALFSQAQAFMWLKFTITVSH